jgi:hypothetical protein
MRQILGASRGRAPDLGMIAVDHWESRSSFLLQQHDPRLHLPAAARLQVKHSVGHSDRKALDGLHSL